MGPSIPALIGTGTFLLVAVHGSCPWSGPGWWRPPYVGVGWQWPWFTGRVLPEYPENPDWIDPGLFQENPTRPNRPVNPRHEYYDDNPTPPPAPENSMEASHGENDTDLKCGIFDPNDSVHSGEGGTDSRGVRDGRHTGRRRREHPEPKGRDDEPQAETPEDAAGEGGAGQEARLRENRRGHGRSCMGCLCTETVQNYFVETEWEKDVVSGETLHMTESQVHAMQQQRVELEDQVAKLDLMDRTPSAS